MEALRSLQHDVALCRSAHVRCMHVFRTSTEKKKESYTWRKTYPHIRISSKEVTWEAATIPRGILMMQDKTCLGRYGNCTPPGEVLSSPPSYRIQGPLTFDTRQHLNREREQDGSRWSFGRQGVCHDDFKGREIVEWSANHTWLSGVKVRSTNGRIIQIWVGGWLKASDIT